MSDDVLKMKGESEWLKILDEIASEVGMVATLVDPDGRILLYTGDYPEVCRRVRSKDETLTFVCGQTSQVMMKQAEKSRKPVVDLCQIGLCKMVVPLFDEDRFLGAVTACARALIGEELDPFLVARELGMAEAEAEELLRSTPQVEEEQVEEMAQRWAERLHKPGQA